MLIIQKFGGTSLASIERIEKAADIVANARALGHEIVVVVSAMAGETDRLIQLAEKMQLTSTTREYDALVSTGECVSAALLAAALQARNIAAISLTGKQAHIQTSGSHGRARITHIGNIISKQLSKKIIPVITGFQGINAKGDVTTLGRGGSDTTAVAIAGKLNAHECQIYTDVTGVYTGDPRMISDARLLSHITYAEMLALSSLGAKVLHPHAVIFAKKHNIPVRILSSFDSGDGTLITANTALKKPRVSGIAFEKKQAKISILGIANETMITEQIMPALDKENFDVDMMVQNHTEQNTIDFTFTVHAEDGERAKIFAKKIANDIAAHEISIDQQVAKLSLVGLGMKSHAGIASKIFQALGEANTLIQLITSTETKISTIIDSRHLETAAQCLHAAFSLEKNDIQLVI